MAITAQVLVQRVWIHWETPQTIETTSRCIQEMEQKERGWDRFHVMLAVVLPCLAGSGVYGGGMLWGWAQWRSATTALWGVLAIVVVEVIVIAKLEHEHREWEEHWEFCVIAPKRALSDLQQLILRVQRDVNGKIGMDLKDANGETEEGIKNPNRRDIMYNPTATDNENERSDREWRWWASYCSRIQELAKVKAGQEWEEYGAVYDNYEELAQFTAIDLTKIEGLNSDLYSELRKTQRIINGCFYNQYNKPQDGNFQMTVTGWLSGTLSWTEFLEAKDPPQDRYKDTHYWELHKKEVAELTSLP